MTPAILAATHAAAFTQTRPWTEDEFADLLAQRSVILLGDAKSFILGRLIGDEAEVLTLATHPDHQRCGLAQTCLAQFITHLRKNGATTVFLEVAEDNIPAKSLYINSNFENCGHRPRYYTTTQGCKIGADILRLQLSEQQ